MNFTKNTIDARKSSRAMYTHMICLVLVLIWSTTTVKSQEIKKFYSVTGGELILSFADIKEGDAEIEDVVRFSPVFNFTELVNYDFSNGFGVFTGLTVRNIGFIADVPNSNLRKKIRTYNVGIPIGLKVGNLGGFFVHGGYEIEFPIAYKEKTFTNDDKTGKFTSWFSGRTPTITNAVYAGVQLPQGVNLKFKYYLSNFFDQDYTEKDESGNPIKPYENLEVNVFYVSVSVFVLKNMDLYQSKKTSTNLSLK